MKLELELPDSRPLTSEDFDRLPHVEGVHLELWDGSLIVAAAAQRAWHSEVVDRVARLFRDRGHRTIREVGVAVGPQRVPVPDVVVFGKSAVVDVNRSQFPAVDVACVVEVTSPESGDRDRLDKPRMYATAGIAEYWIVDQHGDSADAVVRQYRLTPTPDGDQYTLTRAVMLTDLEDEER